MGKGEKAGKMREIEREKRDGAWLPMRHSNHKRAHLCGGPFDVTSNDTSS